MSFNSGIIVGIKAAATGGGIFTVSHIDGASHRVTRGIQPQGASLDLWSHPNSQMTYPIDHKFDANGVVLVPFLWDASGIPQTTSTSAGQVGTRFRWSTKAIPGTANHHGDGALLWFSNVADVGRMGSHFTMPTVPTQRLNRILAQAERRARQLYGIANSMSRYTIAGMVVV